MLRDDTTDSREAYSNFVEKEFIPKDEMLEVWSELNSNPPQQLTDQGIQLVSAHALPQEEEPNIPDWAMPVGVVGGALLLGGLSAALAFGLKDYCRRRKG